MTDYYMILDENGEWVMGMPTVLNQRYRYYDIWGGMIESYWYIPEEETP